MIVIIFLTVFTAAVAAVPPLPPPDSQRILGGSETTIDQYPSTAAVLFSFNLITYEQVCGGIILTTRSALTCAHCLEGYRVNQWRIRVGSTIGNSDGEVHSLSTFIIHHNYNRRTMDSDIAIMFTATTIVYNNNVQPASIASSSYNVADNQVVWATGWGLTDGNQPSEHLRHVQMWSINQNTCQTLYATVSRSISNNMLCAGWLHIGGRAQCTGDSGGPLYHNGVVVGVSSWSHSCGHPQFPSVNVRISRFTPWILTNA